MRRDDFAHDQGVVVRTERGLVVLVAGIVVLAGATGSWWLLRRSRSEPAPQSERATPPPPAPGAATGIVEIESQPADASVAVDGRELGPAPQRVALPGGGNQILLQKDGFEPYSREVHVVPGHTVRLSAQLERPAPRLRVDSDLPGASVFLDLSLIHI